jgi:hypothetical protein
MKLFKLAELTGKDPVDFYKGWHESSIKMLEDYYSMNDDQRRAKLLEAENKFHKSKADRLESERKQEIERTQYHQKLSHRAQLAQSPLLKAPRFAHHRKKH